MSINKISNGYANAFGQLYRTTPKAVFAAVVYSFCSAGGDRQDLAPGNFLEEWRILHEQGIVPQKPPKPKGNGA